MNRKHPQIKDWVLQGYARADVLFIRLIALLHPGIPTAVLVEKANSAIWLERCAIAQNPSTPPKILAQLAQDANRVVRAAAKVSLGR